MPFVNWHYRNGSYVRSHYRRAPRRRPDASTLPLFPHTAPPTRGGARPAGRGAGTSPRWRQERLPQT